MKTADNVLQLDGATRSGVKSAARTMEIIEYFSRSRRPARTSEISAYLKLPNSSVDEILRTLAALGYLTFDRSSKYYSPSYKIVGMMQAIENGFFGGDRLQRLLETLKRETGGSVHMTAQNDCWTESVAQVSGSWQEPADSDVYSPWQIVRYGAKGWRPATNFAGALLTLHTNGMIIDLAVRSQAKGIAPKGTFVMNDLIERVRRIRSRGFAICRRTDTIEVDSIACPMRIPGANVPVAVGVLGYNLLDSEQTTEKLARGIKQVILEHVSTWGRNAA